MLDLTKSVGQGTIKSTTTKPAKNNLAVQEGDKVEIIRMADPNPKGKFLVRITESKAGEFDNTCAHDCVLLNIFLMFMSRDLLFSSVVWSAF